jgi:UDP-2,4-diacetamido-2,4,6-trideoxy-beta-L-altropyranose hydrolase
VPKDIAGRLVLRSKQVRQKTLQRNTTASGAKNLIMRADANATIGTGHVMRCLALAQACQDKGASVAFAAVEIPQQIEKRLCAEGFRVEYIEATAGSLQDSQLLTDLASGLGADWVVLDGYCFGEAYQSAVKRSGSRVLVIDDHGRNGAYCADIILDQNLTAVQGEYAKRTSSTRLLLGSRYAMLRREFRAARGRSETFEPIAKKLLISLGGSDPENGAVKAITALSQCLSQLETTVVVGPTNPFLNDLCELAKALPVQLALDPANLPELMESSEMAIIAGGSTLWELLYVGCAVLSYSRNDVQADVLSRLEELGAVRNLGPVAISDPHLVAAAVKHVATNPDLREKLSKAGRTVVDGQGARRVAEAMFATGASASMIAIAREDREAFTEMAERHFRELNAAFVPAGDWKLSYFDTIQANQDLSLRWLVVNGERAGFILFGIEKHRFLPRKTGAIYELYLEPKYRRRGIGRVCALDAIRELWSHNPSKIQLEVVEENTAAAELWKSLGFQKTTERFVLSKEVQ